MRYVQIALLVSACLAGQVSIGATAPILRDESAIFELLNHGQVNLSRDVASTMGARESQRRIRRIGLEKDGLMIRAAFRDKTVRENSNNPLGVRYLDAYYHELAAYIISRNLELNIVPPTVMRSVFIASNGLRASDKPRQGTLQLWVENSLVEFDIAAGERDYPGNPVYKNQQLREIRIFDCIIGNLDRHAGNLLTDFNTRFTDDHNELEESAVYLGKIWAIDHTKAFHSSIRYEKKHCGPKHLGMQAVSLQFMQGIRKWNVTAVTQALRESGLSQEQVDNLNLIALGKRLESIRGLLEAAQLEAKLPDEEFYSNGIWHQVR